jgi:hypothetical protein
MRKEISNYFRGKSAKKRIWFIGLFILMFITINGALVYAFNFDDYYFYIVKKLVPYPAFVFGNTIITINNYEYEVNLNKKIYESAYRIDFSSKGDGLKNIESLRKNVKQDILDRLIMDDYLSKTGEAVTSKEINEEYKKLVKDIGGDKDVRDILRYSSNISESEIKSKIATNLLKTKFKNNIIYALKIKVIAVRPKDNKAQSDWDEASKKINAISEDIKNNPDSFDRYYLLSNDNNDPMVQNLSGGDYVVADDIPESMRESFYLLGPGKTSDVLKTDSGYYIIRAEEGRGHYKGNIDNFLKEQEAKLRIWSFIR